MSRYDTGVEGEEVEMEGEVDVMIDISGQVMLSTMKYMAGLIGLTVSERSNNIVSSHQYFDSHLVLSGHIGHQAMVEDLHCDA